MKLDNATVLITGANRGIGLAFAKAALARGARKVYAGARDPKSVTLLQLDVNSPADIAAVAAAGDVTVASVASWITSPALAGYAVSKSAVWSLSNGLRNELRGQKTQVLTLHMAFVETDMTQGIASPKSTPEQIVAKALDALEASADEVLADEMTQQVKMGLSAQPGVYLQEQD
ncbi:MAG: hypothetical protein RLZZ373_3291 [Pseudomonadota bacterium]